jgi:hypothetical protein
LEQPNLAEIVDGLAGAATGVENDDGALRGHFEQLGDGGDDSVLRGKKAFPDTSDFAHSYSLLLKCE